MSRARHSFAEPVDLDAPAPKRLAAGTHRTRAPAETLARIAPLLPALGITRVANITGLDRIGIPVVSVYRPNARSVAVAMGKGADLTAARASGLMEALEQYVAERITLPLKLASYEELRYTHSVVEPELLPLAAGASFSPTLPIHWVEGYDLLRREPAWLPFDLVHCNYTVEMSAHRSGLLASSNGLASGNHLLEAISHAICEVVERDALSRWRMLPAERAAALRVDLATVADPVCRDLLGRYAGAGVAVGVWEITTDIGLPTFLCQIADEQPPGAGRVSFGEGMGRHLSRAVALARALTEAAQGRAALLAGVRDGLSPEYYRLATGAEVLEACRARLRLPAARRFDEAPDLARETVNEDLALQLSQLAAAGVRSAVAVDLSRPELGASVARVVVPGLEHMVAAGQPLGPRGQAWLEGRW